MSQLTLLKRYDIDISSISESMNRYVNTNDAQVHISVSVSVQWIIGEICMYANGRVDACTRTWISVSAIQGGICKAMCFDICICHEAKQSTNSKISEKKPFTIRIVNQSMCSVHIDHKFSVRASISIYLKAIIRTCSSIRQCARIK